VGGIDQQRVENDHLQSQVHDQHQVACARVHAAEIGKRNDDAEDVEHDDDPARDIGRPSDHDAKDDVDDADDQRDHRDGYEYGSSRAEEGVAELLLGRVVSGEVRNGRMPGDQDVDADRADAEPDTGS